MDKLAEPKQVKAVHRKYISKFHPDKIIPTGDQEKIYIANNAFAAINEALSLYKVSLYAFQANFVAFFRKRMVLSEIEICFN